MDQFTAALVSKYTTAIPPEYDWFAPLIGDWEFSFYNQQSNAYGRAKGQWLFRRILKGNGIEDVFISPSSDAPGSNEQSGGAYSASIRMFNPKEKCYEMSYASASRSTQMRFVKEGDRLVGTVADNPNEKWYFSNIRPNSFEWHRALVLPNGAWKVACSIYATRKRA